MREVKLQVNWLIGGSSPSVDERNIDGSAKSRLWLPLVHYLLHQVAEAHAAVEQGGVVGKVVIDVGVGG